MDKNLQNLSFYFNSETSPNLFTENSIEIDKGAESASLNWDVVMSFRKTPLSELVERFTDHIKNKYDSSILNIMMEFVSYLLLVSADPSFIKDAKRLRIIDNNAFRMIEPLFKRNSVGSKCLSVELTKSLNIENVSSADIELMLNALISDGVLRRDNGQYCIEGFVLCTGHFY